MAGFNIANTVNNLFSVVYIAMGSAIAIMVGQHLGAGRMKEARDTDNKLIAFSVLSCAAMAAMMFAAAPLFPRLYNTSEAVRRQAAALIMAQAVFMPQNAFMHATYFTLRAGGKTVVTFFFDCVFIWLVSIPVVFLLSRFTSIPAEYIYAAGQIAEWAKCIIGFVLVKKGVWLQNLVKEA